MALIDKASLLMVPSTYEAGKLYNVLPSGNRAPDSTDQNSGYDQTRADFTFDRGSNAAATRIGSDGLIKKYRENLLTESNNFSDSDWLPTETSATSGQSGYDGTNDAWKFTPSAVSGPHRIIRTVSGAGNSVITLSVYAKADGYNFIRISENAATGDYATFNLTDGSVESNTGISNTATTTSVGGGWYRCSFSVDGGVSTRFDIYVMESASVQQPWSGNGTDGILIQNAQLESGLVSTDYLDSGATTAKAGVLIDLPRINYDANGENGSLLLEPSRANLVQFSEYFGGWTAAGCSISANYAISPEGIKNAYLLTYASGGSRIYDFNNITGTSLAISVFVKGVSGNGCHLLAYNLTSSSVQGDMTFSGNTFTKASGSYSAKSESVGDGWYRVSIVVSGFTSGDNIGVYLYTDNNSGTTSGSSLLAYGFQAEPNASYVSSYIPNHSATGVVTRAADSCTGGGSAESINSTEGVFFAHIAALFDEGTTADKWIALSDGTSNNSVRVAFSGGANTIRAYINVGGAVQADLVYSVTDVTQYSKIAFKYKVNDFALWVNGTERATDTSGSVYSVNTLNEFAFDNGGGGTGFPGNVKQVAVFNEALSDSELATLTTL